MLDFLKDVDLALNVLPGHPSAAGFAASLLDKLGSVLHACTSVPASSDHGKLSTREEKRRGETTEGVGTMRTLSHT